ncbi:unnamed protein product [Arctogadus glacialis]
MPDMKCRAPGVKVPSVAGGAAQVAFTGQTQISGISPGEQRVIRGARGGEEDEGGGLEEGVRKPYQMMPCLRASRLAGGRCSGGYGVSLGERTINPSRSGAPQLLIAHGPNQGEGSGPGETQGTARPPSSSAVAAAADTRWYAAPESPKYPAARWGERDGTERDTTLVLPP